MTHPGWKWTLRLFTGLTALLLFNTGCGLVWAFHEETFPPNTFSKIRVVAAEDERTLPDASVSFELLAMRKGFEMWPATLLQENQPIEPPKPVGERAAASAVVETSGACTIGGPSIHRPFPPGDPDAKLARRVDVVRQADRDFAIAPCRVMAACQMLSPLRDPLGYYIDYIHCAVVKVQAPGRAELALWFTADERFEPGWRSDERLYWAYRVRAACEGVVPKGGIESMPRESGWCEITKDQVLIFHLVKTRAVASP